MTKKNIFLILTLLAFVALTACNQKSKDAEMPEMKENMDSHEMEGMDHSMHQENEIEAGEPAEGSIYHAGSVWKNQFDEQIEISELSGKVQVVAMVYTHCEYACPRILADMKRIESSLKKRALEDVNFVIISIDPKRDTPKRLLEFAEENKLSSQNWTLLNGDEGDILEMGALLGVKYKRISDIDFVHSNIITVLNKKGKVVHQRKKLTDNTEDIVNIIQESI